MNASGLTKILFQGLKAVDVFPPTDINNVSSIYPNVYSDTPKLLFILKYPSQGQI